MRILLTVAVLLQGAAVLVLAAAVVGAIRLLRNAGRPPRAAPRVGADNGQPAQRE